MAKSAERLPFSHRGPFVVSRRFSWTGKIYEPGSVFPHRHLAVDHRKLRLLWDAKKIDMEGTPEEPEVMLLGSNVQPNEVMIGGELKLLGFAVEAAFTDSGLTAEEWNELPDDDREARIAAVIDLVAGDGEFVFDPEKHNIEREGKEYWIADDENLLVRVKAKAGKNLDVATAKTLVTAEEILAWAEDDNASDVPDDTEESE
jgi:hypothetical protein